MVFRFFLASILILGQVRAMGQTHSQFQPPSSTHHIPNRIDSLSTPADILAFAQSQPHDIPGALIYQQPLTKRNFVTNAYILRDRQQKDSFGQRPFEKADLDGNGYTDLLWNGYIDNMPFSLLILSFGNNNFQVIRLPKELFSTSFAARLIAIDGKTMIQTWWVLEEGYRPEQREQRVDTLELLSTRLVERLRPHHELHIDTLKFQLLSGGLDLTGGFQLTIAGDSLQLIKGCDAFPKSLVEGGGYFAARLDTSTASQLKAAIGSIDWENLKDEYQAPGSDQKTGYLLLLYDHGKRKKVQDYGIMGTYRLGILEDILLKLLDSQSWTQIATFDPNDCFYFPDGFSNQ